MHIYWCTRIMLYITFHLLKSMWRGPHVTHPITRMGVPANVHWYLRGYCSTSIEDYCNEDDFCFVSGVGSGINLGLASLTAECTCYVFLIRNLKHMSRYHRIPLQVIIHVIMIMISKFDWSYTWLISIVVAHPLQGKKGYS